MSETLTAKKPVSPVLRNITNNDAEAKQRILDNIAALGLNDNLLELEVHGYTVLPGVLSEDRIERAKAAILRRVETNTKRKIDPLNATTADFHGMEYLHYLIFDDPVFPEILLEAKPLALMTYLLGESCVLSSMGCHFRGPGGMPLGVHADGQSDGFLTPTSMVANCNYALTPYTRENGALVMFPGSHRWQRQPRIHENWTAGGETIPEIMAKELPPEELDKVEWELPGGGVTMEINPGDAVIWHGNSWHGGWRRENPGARMNLAAYMCRPFMSTQELRRDTRYPEVMARYANEPRFAQLMGENIFNGWREEGPDFTKGGGRGLFD
ncbi:MAG: phytanoyl-CoA dioxygenase family protein [Pseudomonadota bacterium]